MAFIKFKELTQHFYFFREIPEQSVPSYIRDYIHKDETILRIYKTYRDHGVFTNKKIVLFDQRGTGNVKEITCIPYKSISTLSIKFRKKTTDLFINLNSGYPFRLKFIKLSPQDKKNLRILYNDIEYELHQI